MSCAVEPQATGQMVVQREFVGRRPESEEALAALSAQSQAALRQFSLERTLGYGVDHADAVELRARVLAGQDWRLAATLLADDCLRHAHNAPQTAVHVTRVTCLRRASALLRMSQMLMLSDTEERRAIFAKAADLYRQGADLLRDRQHVQIDTALGTMTGWLFPSHGVAIASAIVVGGIEGWGMDFDSQGESLAARGVDALLLDGPGQGETRLAHGLYLSTQWKSAYRSAIDYLDSRSPGRPIGFVGNSMGGSFAMAVAAEDVRIRACCNNGGIMAPEQVPRTGTFFAKMAAYCGLRPDQDEQTANIWSTVTPVRQGDNHGYPLLMLQGGKDPLVSVPMSQLLLERAPTDDKQMIIFSDGDHCIYNHKQDRDMLIADWLCARLGGLTSHVVTS